MNDHRESPTIQDKVINGETKDVDLELATRRYNEAYQRVFGSKAGTYEPLSREIVVDWLAKSSEYLEALIERNNAPINEQRKKGLQADRVATNLALYAAEGYSIGPAFLTKYTDQQVAVRINNLATTLKSRRQSIMGSDGQEQREKLDQEFGGLEKRAEEVRDFIYDNAAEWGKTKPVQST